MKITSDDFEQDGFIPKKFSGYGDDINPKLNITDIPEGSKSLTLIVEDPDSPGRVWQHWLVWNIPAETTQIVQGALPLGAIEGMNDFGRSGYGGPMPHSGTHHYYFKLYAVNKTLDLPANSTRAQLEAVIKDSIIESTELVGLYSA